MIDIIVTADYETFGNGSGDVRHCVVNPTDELMKMCDSSGAELTLFFEVAEYWAFNSAEKRGLLDGLGCSPAELMRQQAIRAIQAGHDVQLHVHPQWLDSRYTSDGWRVNQEYWRLPTVPHGLGDFEDRHSLRGLLCQGKSELENMLRPYAADYGCVALRAGGSCIQPSRDVIRAMKEVGLKADSSVFKGGYRAEAPYELDFRQAHSECLPWRVDSKDINQAATAPEKDSVWEIPIFTRQRRDIMPITPKTIYHRLVGKVPAPSPKGPSGCQGTVLRSTQRRLHPRSPRERIRYRLAPVCIQWDYCELNATEMWGFLRYFLRKHYTSQEHYFPLVMIGHPKFFSSDRGLGPFLERITHHPLFERGEMGFATMRSAITRLEQGR